jgi:exosortase A
MHREPQAAVRLAEAVAVPSHAVRMAAVVLAALGIVLALYPHTTRSLYAIWLRSDTFAHGLLVFPVFVYMVWNERHRLASVPLRPCAPALALVALAGFGWLLGRLSAALVVEQFCMIALVPAATWVLLGSAALRVLAFPFAFLFLAVPFGDFLVPRLIDLTADFAVAAIKLSGVPIFRQGNSFEIPSGHWSVVEACSGIRYLMASVLGGMLFSYFFFRSWKRRAAMVLVSVLVAIVGNWLRAYLIVMLGHLSSNKLAGGVDHLVYGWVFFGVVIMVLFGIGARWAQRPAPPAAVSASAPRREPRRLLAWAVLVTAMLAAWPAAHALYPPLPGALSTVARIEPAGAWTPGGDALPDWRPSYQPHALLHQSFERDGARVGVFIAYYRNQQERDELVQSRSTVIGPSNLEWAIQRPRQVPAAAGTDELIANAAQVHSDSGEWEVWQWYWIGGQVTADSYVAKAWLALNRLAGRGDDSAAVILYTRASASARADLADFTREVWPAIETALRRTRAGG